MGQYVGDPLQYLVGRQHFLLNGPSDLARYPLSGVAWFGPQLRTSTIALIDPSELARYIFRNGG
jgi:hypothetical protein